MNTQTPFFVGYGTLEALLQSHEAGAPLYAVLASETAPGQFGGAQVVSLVLVVGDVQNGVARQWRRIVGRFSHIAEQPLQSVAQVKRTRERAQQAYELLTHALVFVQRFEVHNALIAAPPDVRILEGDTDCFHYDTPTDSFIAGPAKGQQVAQG